MKHSSVLLLALGLAACGTPRPTLGPETVTSELPTKKNRPPKETEPDEMPAGLSEAELEIQAALRDGNLVEVRDLAEALICKPYIDEAKQLLAQDVGGEALVVLEQALTLAPGQHEVLLLFGEASLRVGVALGDEHHFEKALRAFAQDYRPEALFGSSRAARMLGRNDEALQFAREGLDRYSSADPDWSWGEDPRRTLAEAAFSAWWEKRGEDSIESRALLDETEDALSRLMADRSGDVWAWNRLSTLYFEVERFDDARQAAWRGLNRNPLDEGLAHLLARSAKAGGGRKALMNAFGDFRNKHPEAPLAWWYPAREAFDRVLEGEDDTPIETLQKVQRRFRTCRSEDERYSDDCKRYEVLSRAAQGWHHYNAGNLKKAYEAFVSMDEVVSGGIRFELEGKLESGIVGLVFVADAQQKAGNLAEAAEVFDVLRGFEPENVDFANNAGYFNREAGTELERTAQLMERAARGDLGDKERLKRLRKQAKVDKEDRGTDKEKARFKSAAARRRADSVRAFRRSFEAYQAAAQLAPDDVQVVNDTAVVLVYHLGEQLELAEEYLMRCVEMGEDQRRNEDLTEGERFDLDIAWGDAHQNLGFLYLTHRDDPKTAIEWFEKCIEIGPDPRPLVEEELLPEARRRYTPLRTPVESGADKKKK